MRPIVFQQQQDLSLVNLERNLLRIGSLSRGLSYRPIGIQIADVQMEVAASQLLQLRWLEEAVQCSF